MDGGGMVIEFFDFVYWMELLMVIKIEVIFGVKIIGMLGCIIIILGRFNLDIELILKIDMGDVKIMDFDVKFGSFNVLNVLDEFYVNLK